MDEQTVSEVMRAMAKRSHGRFAHLTEEQKSQYFRLVQAKKKDEAKRLLHGVDNI